MDAITDQQLESLKYPVGRRDPALKADSPEKVAACAGVLERLSAQLREATERLTDAQLDTPYRPGGWTVRQLVHHMADSHMNALIRFKWALSEDEPTIKAYLQDRWVEQADASTLPVEASLRIVDGVHQRWVVLVRALTPEQWKRGFLHPETKRRMALDEVLEMYAWHSRHHLAHITGVITHMGW